MFYKKPDGLAALSTDHFLYPAVLNERYYNGIITASRYENGEKAYELFLNLEKSKLCKVKLELFH